MQKLSEKTRGKLSVSQNTPTTNMPASPPAAQITITSTNLDNKETYLVPDLSATPLSDLISGTGPFAPSSIDSIAYLKHLFTYAPLLPHLRTARTALERTLINKHNVSIARVAPFRLVCTWILHSARQPWWSWKHCNDSADMIAVVGELERLKKEVLGVASRSDGNDEAAVLEREIGKVRERLDGVREESAGERKVARMRVRRG
jgi:hypothetical protein